MSDVLSLEGMEFYGYHGDIEAERALGGRYAVDVAVSADLAAAGRSDSLDDTLDYVRCFQLVREVVEERQYRLVEAVAEAIADALLAQPHARSVRVRVAKQPPLRGVFARFAVEIERSRDALTGGGSTAAGGGSTPGGGGGSTPGTAAEG